MKPENFLEAISVLAQAKSEAEVLQVLKDHPEILDDEVDIMLQQLIYSAKQHGDARAEEILGDMSEFLRTLRSSSSRESSQEGSELSKILQELNRPARLGDMPRRIKLCQKALELIPPENELQWAQLQGELGYCLANSPSGDRADNIERSIEHYNNALKVRTEKDFSEQWAMTQNNLAKAYEDRILGDRADNIDQAIDHGNQALNVYKPREFPSLCRTTARGLGDLYLEGRRFQEAGKAYSQGMEAAEELYGAAIFQSSREAELAETRSLYRRGGYALARSGDAVKAAEALERGRARGLGDALARDRADMEKVRLKNPTAYELYIQAVQALQSLESQERAGASAEGKAVLPQRNLMMQARARMREALDRISRIPGYEDFLKEPGWQEIASEAIVGEPLVYLAAAPSGGIALIVNRPPESQNATVDSVNLDGFSEQRLQELLNTWFDAYRGWQEVEENWCLDKISAEEYLQAKEKERWLDAIEVVTGQLWQDVMKPIYGVLQSLNAQQAFLIPMGLLSLLPLHAAWHEEDGRKRYLQEMLPISYAPSARALSHARRNACSADRLLAVDEPRLVKPSPLPNSHTEVSAISSLFQNPMILEHEKATAAQCSRRCRMHKLLTSPAMGEPTGATPSGADF
jgi:hypothetical protein